MRNPIRLKNLNPRFIPLYVLLGLILVCRSLEPAAIVRGLPFILIGLSLRGWATGHLVKTHALTLTGPYAYLRHPLYLGTALILCGFALQMGGVLSVLMLTCTTAWFVLLYFPRKEESESQRLMVLHGQRFEDYRTSVPALWPRLTPWNPSAEHEVEGDARWSFDRYSENNELGTLIAVILGMLLFGLRALLSHQDCVIGLGCGS